MSSPEGAPRADGRALRLAGGAVATLLGLVALVLWRGPDVAALGAGWAVALTTTGVLAVVGLLVAVVLAGLVAVSPPPADDVVVRVPASGEASAQVQPSHVPAARLRAALLAGAASVLPLLVVLVLAAGALGGSASGGAAASAEVPAAEPSASGPSSSGPGPAASGGPSPPGSETAAPAPADPPPPPAAAPPPAPPPTEAPPPAATPPPASPPPASPPPASPPPDGGAGGTDGGCQRVVVQGDTLWDLTAERLGADTATNADLVAGTAALYEANAAVIGGDPDLIQPGTVLDTCP